MCYRMKIVLLLNNMCVLMIIKGGLTCVRDRSNATYFYIGRQTRNEACTCIGKLINFISYVVRTILKLGAASDSEGKFV